MSDALREQTRRAYDVVAASYARMLPNTGFESPLDLAMVQHLVHELSPSQGSAVLDAGCGPGRMMTHLASLDASLALTGVDFSAAMVERARAAHPDRRIEQGDLADLPFEDGRFDGVLGWYSIIHTPPLDLPVVLGELRRVLRPGGLLLLAFQVGSGAREISRPYGHDVPLRAFLHGIADIEERLGAVGFASIASLERAPRSAERHPQGFVLAARR